MAGEGSDAEWREFVRDERLSAGVDYPLSLFWKDLVKMYPNAKVTYSAGEDYPIFLFWKDLVRMYPKAKVKQALVRAIYVQ